MDSATEVDVKTPRGSVNVDVFATDGGSVDNIKYIVECKNWGTPIPQTVVHAFTTVMHETGANIGFIISKQGLQCGAEQYTTNTNITGLTYLEFQQRYFEVWWYRYFCPRIGDAGDRLWEFVEDYNPDRDEKYETLTDPAKDEFDRLKKAYYPSGMIFSMFNMHIISPTMETTGKLLIPPANLQEFLERLALITPHIRWRCSTFRELLEGVLEYLSDAVEEFNALFGRYIFETRPISGVGPEGPQLKSLTNASQSVGDA